jgi:hypothetical protein
MLAMWAMEDAPSNLKAQECDEIAEANSSSERRKVLLASEVAVDIADADSVSRSMPTAISAVEKMLLFRGKWDIPTTITVSLYS